MSEGEGRLARLRSNASARWAQLKRRRSSVRHMAAAWEVMQRNNGAQYAAAITFFSFLALFPLILLAVAVTGFFLKANPGTQQDLFAHLTDKVPGALGETLKSSLKAAIESRASLSIVGLVGVLFTGLGWIGNLRAAIDGVWGRAPAKINFFKAKLANLIVLAGLGIGAVLSIALTVVGTSLTDQILRAIGLDDLPGATLLLKLLGIVLAVAGDMIIFWWLLIRLPQQDVPTIIAVKSALLAAVGFEALKIVGSYTIAHTANSPTAGPYAAILGVLIWIQLVARFMLFACAWAAAVTTEHREMTANMVPIAEPPAMAEAADTRTAAEELSPAAVGASLVAAGALAGAAATAVALNARRGGEGAGRTRRRRR